MERPLVVLDTESPTLRGAPRLLELGAVRVVDGEIEDHFSSLVCPAVPIEPDAAELHGIDDEAVRDAPPLGDVLQRFSAWVGEDWMAAHRAESDAEVLAFEYARTGLAEPPAPFIDSLALARRFLSEAPDHKLPTLREFLELDADEGHRALPDAVTCWKVIEECIERAGGLQSTSLRELLSLCGAPTTIASQTPRAPRLKPRQRGITQALQDSDEIQMLYGDDAESPAVLRVRPLFLYERARKGYMEAECLQSGLTKTYLIDRIHKLL